MRIEDRKGTSLTEATITVGDEEIIDLLQGIADVIEGKREHLHFAQVGGPQLVVRRSHEDDADPIGHQMDWWAGPLILFGTLFIIIGFITVVRWGIGLVS